MCILICFIYSYVKIKLIFTTKYGFSERKTVFILNLLVTPLEIERVCARVIFVLYVSDFTFYYLLSNLKCLYACIKMY